MQGDSLLLLGQYINTSKAMTMIFGILLSIIVAFICGSVVQLLSRLFTFDYRSRMKRYGAIWGGIALGFITYFILIKGAAGSVFITPRDSRVGRDPYHDDSADLVLYFSSDFADFDYLEI